MSPDRDLPNNQIEYSEEYEKREIIGYLPDDLYKLIEEANIPGIKIEAEASRKLAEGRLPVGVRVKVRKLKQEGHTPEAQNYAAAEWVKKFGVTERRRDAARGLLESIASLADMDDREQQVLCGMKIAWLSYAAGIIDEDRRTDLINEIQAKNMREMIKIDEYLKWETIFKESIRRVLPSGR